MLSTSDAEQTYNCVTGEHKFEYDHYAEEAVPDIDGPGTRYSVYRCVICGKIQRFETQDYQDIQV